VDYADLRTHPILIEPLTDRELEILRLLSDDLSIPAIAERLVLSPATVKWYTQQIYGKLDIQESGQKRHLAVAKARALGLLEAERTPAGRPRYSLPVQTTAFVGRARELNEIAAPLANPDVQLVTLLGPGGMGKTRLALEVGWRMVEPAASGLPHTHFPDGAYFVLLQPVGTPDNLPWAVAEAVAFPFQGDGRSPERQLLDFFREKRLLLVIDNFEYLLNGVALVNAILEAAPGIQVLATSRETRNLNTETVYHLKGLPFPGEVETALDYDAARLFVQGAQRARADFALQPDDLPALARICALVEGMPLGILLAAAWIEVLSLPENRRGDRGQLRLPGRRDARRPTLPVEHPRRVRADLATAWPDRSGRFMWFSVFRGGCTRQAAQAVTGASLPILQAMVNKAILSRTLKGCYEAAPVFRGPSQDGGQTEATHDAHCAHYADFMHARQNDLKGSDRQIAAPDEIEANIENVRANWAWAVAQQWAGNLLSMEWTLWYFLTIRGRFAEGFAFWRTALEATEDRIPRGRLMACHAFFCPEVGRQQEWDECSAYSLDIVCETGDPGDLAFALCTRMLVLGYRHHNFEQVYRMADECLRLWQAQGNL